MTTDYLPRHRKNKLVKRYPKVQPVPRHAGEYVPEDRTHARLGAQAFDVDEFKGVAVR